MFQNGPLHKRKKGIREVIGFYDYTVILTYVSFASSIYGMICAMTGHFRWAIFCLALSGLCDMFDGKIARRKKDRTEDEKRFGIQIDSLCDVVFFVAFFHAAPPVFFFQDVRLFRFYP